MKHMTNKHLKRRLTAALAVCCMTVSSVIPTGAMLTASAAYSTGTYTVSGQSANIRQNPGETVIGYVKNGTAFSVSKIDGDWGYSASIPATSGKTIAGWISLNNCTQTSVSQTTTGFAVGSKVEITNTDAVNFRSGVGTSYALLGTIPRGTVLTISEVSGDWLRVTYGGQTGWFKSSYCKAYTEPAPAPNTTVAAVGDKIEVVNTDQVNFRSGAGTGYALIGTIPRNALLTVEEVSGTWFRVTFDGKTGWISSSYAKKYTAPQPSENTNTVAAVGDKVEITNTDAVNYRTGAGTGYSLIGTIPRGTVLTILEISGNWFRVEYNHKSGWFNAGYCKKYVDNSAETPALAAVGEKVKVNAPSAVNMRSGAGTGFALLGTIPAGTILTVKEVTDGWYRVTYDGKDGWFTSRYGEKYTETTTPITPPTEQTQPSGTITAGNQVKITAAVAVNMRSGAGTSYTVVGTIPKGKIVTVTEASNGWFRTEYNGKTGWFVGQYCEKYADAPADTPVTPDPPAATPAFKADDQVKVTAADAVNLRSGSGTSFDVIDIIPNGAVLTVAEVSGDWLRVAYNGRIGWISSRYCIKQNTEANESVTPGGKLTVNAAVSVTLRQSATPASAAIGWIKGGTVLSFTEKSNNWYKVNYNGKTGWISGTYVKES